MPPVPKAIVRGGAWYPGRVVRQRSAKPRTAVRICWVPPGKAVCGQLLFFYAFSCITMALTEEEKAFLQYWETNRLGKKKFLRQFTVAFPLTVLMIAVLFINIFSGWDKRAEMIIRGDASSLYVVVIAVIGIAVFITVFSSRHKWEQNEQRYLELRQKEKEAGAAYM